ncbi:MAG: nucleotidyltransferase substrate binding protein [Planctomycetes bacterium]|nr:nucleotidyltransferase substrate binding protein [Planctomycetota bacterium]
MSNSDGIRWQQCHDNFEKALERLNSACQKEEYSDLERAGLVQMFEFTFELAWKTMKDLLFFGGLTANTPREAIRQSFVAEWLSEADAEALLDALQKKNLLTHTYEAAMAVEAERLIKLNYAPALRRLFDSLQAKRPKA